MVGYTEGTCQWLTRIVITVLAASVGVIGTDASQQVPQRGGEPDDWSAVGLGSKVTILVVLAPDCQPCEATMGFYKALMALPVMDGAAGRVIVVARGVGPMSVILKKHAFKPHRLTSGPAIARSVPVPSVIVLNRDGQRAGAWAGLLDPTQEKEILRAIQVLSSGMRVR